MCCWRNHWVTLAKLYKLPLKWFFQAVAMPTQNIPSQKNILKRPPWKFLLVVQSKDCEKTFGAPADQHMKDMVWAWYDKLHGFSTSWDFLQTSGSFSLPNYDALQGICNYICMFRGGGISAQSSNVDIDVLVHSQTNIWLAMLESWLDPALYP